MSEVTTVTVEILANIDDVKNKARAASEQLKSTTEVIGTRFGQLLTENISNLQRNAIDARKRIEKMSDTGDDVHNRLQAKSASNSERGLSARYAMTQQGPYSTKASVDFFAQLSSQLKGVFDATIPAIKNAINGLQTDISNKKYNGATNVQSYARHIIKDITEGTSGRQYFGTGAQQSARAFAAADAALRQKFVQHVVANRMGTDYLPQYTGRVHNAVPMQQKYKGQYDPSQLPKIVQRNRGLNTIYAPQDVVRAIGAVGGMQGKTFHSQFKGYEINKGTEQKTLSSQAAKLFASTISGDRLLERAVRIVSERGNQNGISVGRDGTIYISDRLGQGTFNQIVRQLEDDRMRVQQKDALNGRKDIANRKYRSQALQEYNSAHRKLQRFTGNYTDEDGNELSYFQSGRLYRNDEVKYAIRQQQRKKATYRTASQIRPFSSDGTYQISTPDSIFFNQLQGVVGRQLPLNSHVSPYYLNATFEGYDPSNPKHAAIVSKMISANGYSHGGQLYRNVAMHGTGQDIDLKFVRDQQYQQLVGKSSAWAKTTQQNGAGFRGNIFDLFQGEMLERAVAAGADPVSLYGKHYDAQNKTFTPGNRLNIGWQSGDQIGVIDLQKLPEQARNGFKNIIDGQMMLSNKYLQHSMQGRMGIGGKGNVQVMNAKNVRQLAYAMGYINSPDAPVMMPGPSSDPNDRSTWYDVGDYVGLAEFSTIKNKYAYASDVEQGTGKAIYYRPEQISRMYTQNLKQHGLFQVNDYETQKTTAKGLGRQAVAFMLQSPALMARQAQRLVDRLNYVSTPEGAKKYVFSDINDPMSAALDKGETTFADPAIQKRITSYQQSLINRSLEGQIIDFEDDPMFKNLRLVQNPLQAFYQVGDDKAKQGMISRIKGILSNAQKNDTEGIYPQQITDDYVRGLIQLQKGDIIDFSDVGHAEVGLQRSPNGRIGQIITGKNRARQLAPVYDAMKLDKSGVTVSPYDQDTLSGADFDGDTVKAFIDSLVYASALDTNKKSEALLSRARESLGSDYVNEVMSQFHFSGNGDDEQKRLNYINRSFSAVMEMGRASRASQRTMLHDVFGTDDVNAIKTQLVSDKFYDVATTLAKKGIDINQLFSSENMKLVNSGVGFGKSATQLSTSLRKRGVFQLSEDQNAWLNNLRNQYATSFGLDANVGLNDIKKFLTDNASTIDKDGSKLQQIENEQKRLGIQQLASGKYANIGALNGLKVASFNFMSKHSNQQQAIGVMQEALANAGFTNSQEAGDLIQAYRLANYGYQGQIPEHMKAYLDYKTRILAAQTRGAKTGITDKQSAQLDRLFQAAQQQRIQNLSNARQDAAKMYPQGSKAYNQAMDAANRQYGSYGEYSLNKVIHGNKDILARRSENDQEEMAPPVVEEPQQQAQPQEEPTQKQNPPRKKGKKKKGKKKKGKKNGNRSNTKVEQPVPPDYDQVPPENDWMPPDDGWTPPYDDWMPPNANNAPLQQIGTKDIQNSIHTGLTLGALHGKVTQGYSKTASLYGKDQRPPMVAAEEKRDSYIKGLKAQFNALVRADENSRDSDGHYTGKYANAYTAITDLEQNWDYKLQQYAKNQIKQDSQYLQTYGLPKDQLVENYQSQYKQIMNKKANMMAAYRRLIKVSDPDKETEQAKRIAQDADIMAHNAVQVLRKSISDSISEDIDTFGESIGKQMADPAQKRDRFRNKKVQQLRTLAGKAMSAYNHGAFGDKNGAGRQKLEQIRNSLFGGEISIADLNGFANGYLTYEDLVTKYGAQSIGGAASGIQRFAEWNKIKTDQQMNRVTKSAVRGVRQISRRINKKTQTPFEKANRLTQQAYEDLQLKATQLTDLNKLGKLGDEEYKRAMQAMFGVGYDQETVDKFLAGEEVSGLGGLHGQIGSSYKSQLMKDAGKQRNKNIMDIQRRMHSMDIRAQKRANYSPVLRRLYQNESEYYTRQSYAQQMQRDLQALKQQEVAYRNDFIKNNGSDKGLAKDTEYQKIGNAIGTLTTRINQNAQAMDNLKGVSGGMNAIFGTIGDSVNRLSTTFTRQLFRNAISQIKRFVMEYDQSMTSIQMATMKTDEEMQSIRGDTVQQAIDLRANVSDVANTKLALYRQGLSDSQVDDRLQSIIKFSRVTGVKSADATKVATSAVQTGLVKNTQQALDVLAALGDSAATTAGQISKGIQKSGASAKVAGVSYNELASLLTIGTSKTQLGGTQIGTALNTIFSRMRNITSKNYVADQTGDVTTLNEVQRALGIAGVSLRGDNGNMRSAYDVLRDVAGNWNNLNDTQKGVVTTAMAGTRQSNIFQTLMEGMSQDDGALLDKYLGLAEGSEGAVQSKYEIAMQSLAASMDTFRSSFDGLVESMTNNGLITGVIDGISAVFQSLMEMSNNAGAITSGFTLIAGALTALAIPLLLAKTAVAPVSTLLGLAAGVGVVAAIGLGGSAINSALGKNKKSTTQRIDQNRELMQQEYYKEIQPMEDAVQQLKLLKDGYQQASNAGLQLQFKTDNAEKFTKVIETLTKRIPGLSQAFASVQIGSEGFYQSIKLATQALQEYKREIYGNQLINTRYNFGSYIQEAYDSFNNGLGIQQGQGNVFYTLTDFNKAEGNVISSSAQDDDVYSSVRQHFINRAAANAKDYGMSVVRTGKVGNSTFTGEYNKDSITPEAYTIDTIDGANFGITGPNGESRRLVIGNGDGPIKLSDGNGTEYYVQSQGDQIYSLVSKDGDFSGQVNITDEGQGSFFIDENNITGQSAFFTSGPIALSSLSNDDSEYADIVGVNKNGEVLAKDKEGKTVVAMSHGYPYNVYNPALISDMLAYGINEKGMFVTEKGEQIIGRNGPIHFTENKALAMSLGLSFDKKGYLGFGSHYVANKNGEPMFIQDDADFASAFNIEADDGGYLTYTNSSGVKEHIVDDNGNPILSTLNKVSVHTAASTGTNVAALVDQVFQQENMTIQRDDEGNIQTVSISPNINAIGKYKEDPNIRRLLPYFYLANSPVYSDASRNALISDDAIFAFDTSEVHLPELPIGFTTKSALFLSMYGKKTPNDIRLNDVQGKTLDEATVAFLGALSSNWGDAISPNFAQSKGYRETLVKQMQGFIPPDGGYVTGQLLADMFMSKHANTTFSSAEELITAAQAFTQDISKENGMNVFFNKNKQYLPRGYGLSQTGELIRVDDNGEQISKFVIGAETQYSKDYNANKKTAVEMLSQIISAASDANTVQDVIFNADENAGDNSSVLYNVFPFLSNVVSSASSIEGKNQYYGSWMKKMFQDAYDYGTYTSKIFSPLIDHISLLKSSGKQFDKNNFNEIYGPILQILQQEMPASDYSSLLKYLNDGNYTDALDLLTKTGQAVDERVIRNMSGFNESLQSIAKIISGLSASSVSGAASALSALNSQLMQIMTTASSIRNYNSGDRGSNTLSNLGLGNGVYQMFGQDFANMQVGIIEELNNASKFQFLKTLFVTDKMFNKESYRQIGQRARTQFGAKEGEPLQITFENVRSLDSPYVFPKTSALGLIAQIANGSITIDEHGNIVMDSLNITQFLGNQDIFGTASTIYSSENKPTSAEGRAVFGNVVEKANEIIYPENGNGEQKDIDTKTFLETLSDRLGYSKDADGVKKIQTMLQTDPVVAMLSSQLTNEGITPVQFVDAINSYYESGNAYGSEYSPYAYLFQKAGTQGATQQSLIDLGFGPTIQALGSVGQNLLHSFNQAMKIQNVTEKTAALNEIAKKTALTLRGQLVSSLKLAGRQSGDAASYYDGLAGSADDARAANVELANKLQDLASKKYYARRVAGGQTANDDALQALGISKHLPDQAKMKTAKLNLQQYDAQANTLLSEAFNAALIKDGAEIAVNGNALEITIDGQPVITGTANEQGIVNAVNIVADNMKNTALGALMSLIGEFATLSFVIDKGDTSATAKFELKELGGKKGGGGGGGKSAAKKLLQKHKRDKAEYDHIVKMIQYEQTKYKNRGQLGNYGLMVEKQIQASRQRQTRIGVNIKQLKDMMNSTKVQSDDWYELRDAIMEAEEEYQELDNKIEENITLLKENRQEIYKLRTQLQGMVKEQIEARKQEQEQMLSGSVNMQTTILDAIKQRYQDEWDLIKKDIQKKKQALEQEKSLIDERLRKRKDAQDEEEKYKELTELRTQLAMIQLDSTRTKDAASLRQKIAQLEKEIGWDKAQAQVQNQTKVIDDQIKAYDEYVTQGDEDMQKYLQDANNFVQQISSVMKMSQEQMFNWLQTNVKDYVNTFKDAQTQMTNEWENTYKSMLGIVETYWDQINSILSGRNDFLEYMKSSTDYLNASNEQRAQMLYEWQKAYDDYLAAQKTDARYAHSDDYGNGSYSLPYDTPRINIDNILERIGVTSASGYNSVATANLKNAYKTTTAAVTTAASTQLTQQLRTIFNSASYARLPYVTGVDTSSFVNNGGIRIDEIQITVNEAQFNSEQDYDTFAAKIGDAFVKELSKQGIHTASYSF